MPGRRPAFPHIGWDPTPGDVADTRDLAKTLGGLATDLGEAVRDLDRIDAGAWKGKAANAFVEYVGEDVTPLIRKSHQSFGKASRALHRWSRELQDFQDEADRLEVRAGEKLAAKEKAEKAAEGKGSKELGEASGEVDEITRKVRDLQDRYNRAAAEITKELDKAGDIAPDEPGFWGKLTQGVKDAWDATTDWVKEHADLIALIGDLLSDLTALLGFLAIATLPFPPLAAIFGTAALVTTGLALAAHSIAKAGGADVSWAKIGLDAVGLMPGIGMFSKGVKVVGGACGKGTRNEAGKGVQSYRTWPHTHPEGVRQAIKGADRRHRQGRNHQDRRQIDKRLRGGSRWKRSPFPDGRARRSRISQRPVGWLQNSQLPPRGEHQPCRGGDGHRWRPETAPESHRSATTCRRGCLSRR